MHAVKLQPVTLVDCIVLPISWVANIKFKEEPAVTCAQRIEGHQVQEHDPCKPPFPGIVVAKLAQDKKLMIGATHDGDDKQQNGGNGWNWVCRCSRWRSCN